MSELRKKPLIRHGERIGEAATRAEVRDLLLTQGLNAREAAIEEMTFCVEGPDAFEILPPGSQEQIVAGVRRVKGIAHG